MIGYRFRNYSVGVFNKTKLNCKPLFLPVYNMQDAYTYEEYGDHNKVLKKTSIPIPEIGEGDVLIKVVASAINPVDYKIMEGYIKGWPQNFPIVPGWDVAGTVEKSNSPDFRVGDEVYAYTRPAFDMLEEHPDSKSESIGTLDGTFASYVAVKAWKVAKKPTSASLEESAAVPLAALTAYQALHDMAGISKGKTVVIVAASGGVGSYAVGFAKEAGANVIGTCSARNFDYVKSLGANDVRDYNVDGYLDGIEADIVFDCAGGKSARDALAVLKPGGKIVSIVEFEIGNLAKKVDCVGIAFLVKPGGDQLRTIGKLIDDGKITIPKINLLPFDKVYEGFDQIKGSRTVGKIVIQRD